MNEFTQILDDIKKQVSFEERPRNYDERYQLFRIKTNAWDSINRLCDEYMKVEVTAGNAVRSLLDPHAVWIISLYIELEMESIFSPADARHLQRCLLAIAIIGESCDPRDVGLWALELYRLGVKYKIPGYRAYFKTASDLASTTLLGYAYGTNSVSGLLGEYANKN